MATCIYDTEEFKLLKDKSIISKIVTGVEQKYVHQCIGYHGDIQTTNEQIMPADSKPDLQERLSFTTERTIYKYIPKFQEGDNNKRRKLPDLFYITICYISRWRPIPCNGVER
eukprot:NODE_154_length_16838_cov_0.293327.p9 type:complete len:113 gc:universal NODE_154_length_16838_cov_0.293327:6511-6173(-)